MIKLFLRINKKTTKVFNNFIHSMKLINKSIYIKKDIIREMILLIFNLKKLINLYKINYSKKFILLN